MIMLKTIPQDVTPPVSVPGTFSVEMNTPSPVMTTVDSLEAALKSQACSKPFLKDSFLQMSNTVNCKSSNRNEIPLSIQTCSNLQSNLFHAGFEDCASEVIRFLVEQEKMDDHNPLIQGLQSHLRKMSSTICAENISDLDRCQQQITPPSDIKSLDPFSLSSHSFELNSDSESLQNKLHLSSELSLKRKHGSEYSRDLSSSSIDSELYSASSKKKCLERLHEPNSNIECTKSVTSSSTSNTTVISGIQNAQLVSFDNHLPSSSSSLFNQPSFTSVSCDSKHQFPMFFLPQPLGQSSPLPSIHSSFFPSLFSSSSTSEISSKSSENHPADITHPTPTLSTDDLSSILELKAHFLPGIDTSSLASGNFADILLAVESCQSHESPRVRELADRIIGLIHNNEDEEEDEEEDDGEFEDDNVDNHESAGSVEHEDSGVDLGEDAADWCNPVDMIEL